MEILTFEGFNHTINHLNFKIFTHGYVNTGSEWKSPKINSPFSRLYYIISGSGTITTNEKCIEMKAGHAYLIPLHFNFNYSCADRMQNLYIHFRIELLQGLDLLENYSKCGEIAVDPAVVKTLKEGAASGEIAEIINCKSIILSHISEFLKPYSNSLQDQIKTSTKYAELYQYVKDNSFANLRVKDIADFLGLSASYLSNIFKTDMGITLKKFIDNKLIQKAQDMLLMTDLPVKEIAFELKFLDEFHFSKFFKKYNGLSPTHYRQKNIY